MIFKVKFSTFVKVITVIVIPIIIYGSFELFSVGYLDTTIAGIALLLLMAFFVTQTPLKIVIENESFILYKFFGKKEMIFSQISDIKYFNSEWSDLRLLGSCGLFGYYGKFSNNEIGSYMSYVGDFGSAFVVTTKAGKNFAFSCENSDLFIETVKKNITL